MHPLTFSSCPSNPYQFLKVLPLLLIAWQTQAQTVALNAENPVGLELRGVAEMSPDARIALAQTSEPLWVEVKDPNTQLGEVLRTTCGDQPASTTRYLEARTLKLNNAENLAEIVLADEAVNIPFCLRVDYEIPFTVNKGDSASRILKREYGVDGPKTLKRFYQLNRDRYRTFDEFTRNLVPQDEVLVPYVSEPRVWRPTSSFENPLRELTNILPRRQVRDQVLYSLQNVQKDVQRDRHLIKTVAGVNFAGIPSHVACNGKAGQFAQIDADGRMQSRFSVEKNNFFERTKRDKLVPATVGLIDSGLKKIGDDFFHQAFFHANLGEVGLNALVDDDNNDLIDDIYGRNFYSYQDHGRVEPFPGAPNAAHGTKMGALILGGIELAQQWNSTFSPPAVRLKVVSFFDGDPENTLGTASPVELRSAINYLKDTQTNSVNLSLATASSQFGLRNSIEQAPNMLFIVAAGNATIGGGRKLGNFGLFPAMYGGIRGLRNVVTVAAHDLSGNRASFSNYSRDYVDLLAPGCVVPTRDLDGAIVQESGTSASTAIVSFAASLVRSLGLTKPAQIKRRLQVGTDFDESLDQDAFSSGRINIVKAISLSHDVVETTKREMFFGVIGDPSKFAGACEEDVKIEGTIRKVVTKSGLSKNLEIWSSIDNKIHRESCTLRDDGFSFNFTSEVDSHQMSLSEIREIVFREFDFR